MLKQATALVALCALAGCGCPPGTPPASAPPPIDSNDKSMSQASEWNESQSLSDPQETK
jgi:hypothetical protein